MLQEMERTGEYTRLTTVVVTQDKFRIVREQTKKKECFWFEVLSDNHEWEKVDYFVNYNTALRMLRKGVKGKLNYLF